MTLRFVLAAGAAISLLGACGSETTSESEMAASGDASVVQAPDAPMIEPWGYPMDAFDQTVHPGDDFFQFANGGWLASTEIPSDRSGTGFAVDMSERNEERIAEIISDLSDDDLEEGSDSQKIRDLYNDFMDTDVIEAAGLEVAREHLDMIAAASTHEDIARLMGTPELSTPGPFALYVSIDSKSPTDYTLGATHAGLGMPERSYYLRDSERLNETRTAYNEFLVDMLALATDDEENVEERAAAVYALEEAIAEQHWTRAERRNADRTYNGMQISELAEMAPGYPWRADLTAQGLPAEGYIVVREKEAFAPLAALFAETPVAVWKDYLRIQYLSTNSRYLSDEVYLTAFSFYGEALQGQSEPRPREKRGIEFVNSALDQAVGKEYIARYFPEESKVLMTEMFENIRTALSMRIENLEWMTDDTKLRAQEKLAAMTAKIAYPEKWTDYSHLSIVPSGLYENVMRIRTWSAERDANYLGTKVDKREWFSAPQTVNAFYSPNRNEAFIPAGYIQPPLFDPAADPAINYGAIGSIIGHEIGHGFDDQGSKYDANGVLQSWWTEDDRAAFDALGDRLADQFSEYEPLPGLNVNGRQTLGENIGDLAGVLVTYHAYKLSLDGEPSPVLDGFTGEQRVFLGRAQARRYKRTEESLRQRLLSAPHSPMKLRVNGMVRNIDEWYDAFDIGPDHAMYLPPEERVRIW